MNRISFKIADRLLIGAYAPIIVQTMCNTATQDIEASLEQCRAMYRAGAQMIRLTTQGMLEVEALSVIKARLHEEGIMAPLVADVHFSASVALAVARVADKVRINPGNFAPTHEEACAKFAQLLDVCRQNGTAIRIGLNHGSLGERITSKYGNTPLAMKEAVMEWLNMCLEHDFYNVVVSLKASNTRVMVDAYRLLYKAMEETGTIFPLHLGVTEAGNGEQGRIKSALGIGALLSEGIGDTIRVSLTENPVNEIEAGETILKSLGLDKAHGNAVACSAMNDTQIVNSNSKKIKCRLTADSWNEFIIKASALYGPALLDNKIDELDLSGSTIGGESISEDKLLTFNDMLLQAVRRKFTSPEYIACPGCGRTLYNLEDTFNEVKRRTAHLHGVKIAVMGCIVNGPGEMADADYGYVGEGRGKVTLYKGKTPVKRSIPQEQAIDLLLQLIENDK